MLTCWRCCQTPNRLVALGTIIEQFPFFKPKASRTRRIYTELSTITTTTSASIKPSHFETLSSRQKDQIHLYVDALLQWNQKMNLTAVTEVSEVMERHVEDSLAILPPIRTSYISCCSPSCDNICLIDVGSGPGLPGLILAIACPGWNVTLLESMNKRCVFLEHAVSVTGLSNVKILRGRAENLGQNACFREHFDVAVARAVAEMRILAEYCLPLVRVGGLFVAAKGHDPQVHNWFTDFWSHKIPEPDYSDKIFLIPMIESEVSRLWSSAKETTWLSLALENGLHQL
ncbi:uncharacterized protein LOC110816851 isoform X3 [Carica papaya]|uniref:uncharacterized protein LOC110816851 isoform X3 n=1 Tax=Carica papaya TaxID=3649 RepID=UPI000B8CA740|nr:uncharacterized protein LOC110816851 isoform X3 [Carica papaya]